MLDSPKVINRPETPSWASVPKNHSNETSPKVNPNRSTMFSKLLISAMCVATALANTQNTYHPQGEHHRPMQSRSGFG